MSVILTLNAGSSSLKFGLYAWQAGTAPSLLGKGQIERIGQAGAQLSGEVAGTPMAKQPIAAADHDAALAWLFAWLQRQYPQLELVGIGHRVVHGGTRYHAPVLLDADALAYLAGLQPLAPLHQPHNLKGVHAAQKLLPGLPQIACFDTAFHRTQPDLAQMFALPRRYFDAGIRRYGFHGLSYQYIAERLPAVLGPLADGRVVVAHLGNGASACALLRRQSQASSMGFTALDGLMMGTRCGRIDPGVLLHLLQAEGMTPAALEKLLYLESGLLGVSGISQDMRSLLASSEPAAAQAVALYCQRAAGEIASLAASIGGLDALIFTAGIGEHAAAIRQGIAERLAFLGLYLDPVAQRPHADGTLRLHAGWSRQQCWVIPTDEESVLAAAVAAQLTA